MPYKDAETPTGTINGSNATFTLAASPQPLDSLVLILDGLIQMAGTDFTLTNNQVVYGTAPTNGAIHQAWYRYSSTPTVVTGPTWADNADGTATISVTFDRAATCGIDLGVLTTKYTGSAMSYIGDDPANALLSASSHSFTVPEQDLGTETLPDGTYFWRLKASNGINHMPYVAAEDSDVITSP